MARTDQETVEKLRDILKRQLELEDNWLRLVSNIVETDLKDPISEAFSRCGERLQVLVESLQQRSLPMFKPARGSLAE